MSLDITLLNPVEGECEHCLGTGKQHEGVYQANVTHNLVEMADKAGLYKIIWRPEELGLGRAGQLIIPLKYGIICLTKTPSDFKSLEPSNGWGTYEGFVSFLQKYLQKCTEYPNAKIKVDR